MVKPIPHIPEPQLRLKVCIRGAVQGVGFRPFVYRLATELKLPGWVSNTSEGVFVEAEGAKEILDQFVLRLQNDKPPRAFIQSFEFSFLGVVGYPSFEIRESDGAGSKTVLILPDIATCPDCLAEIFDPHNRRYLYPFTNCTNCGPRFSIIESLPYDRPNTSMKRFVMCPDCQREYDDPNDRRFHAQPTACPACGPGLELWNEEGKTIARHRDALLGGEQAIRGGKIVAVKGLGGFHLMVDARSDEAVRRLRERKHREEKPLALMFPSIEAILEECVVSDFERRLLLSPESPIVLLERKDNRELYGKLVSTLLLADSVAPSNPNFGIMLPYTPLHHMLMADLGHPVIATSGNISDEPICIDEREAVRRLRGIVDVLLVHNRPIVRHIDDSIVRVMMGRELVMRRARGYAPLPVQLTEPVSAPILALGAHLKNTVALAVGTNAFVSQHIGDLETRQSLEAFRKVVADFQSMYEATPALVACDIHPDYFSTKEGRAMGPEVVEVQHHYAHVMSCMAENQLEGEVLGVSWDGTGFGTDSTVWGGEFLISRGVEFERFASFRQFRLPGGEKAVKEPRRSAAGLLYELFGDDFLQHKDNLSLSEFTVAELSVVHQMLKRGVNAPLTSSVGRLFDAVASIIGLRQRNTFEGQAALELEFALTGERSEQTYRCDVMEAPLGPLETNTVRDPMRHARMMVDWATMVREMMVDVHKVCPRSLISKKFHNALVGAVVEVAKKAGLERVALSGGCFQNKFLTERTVRQLRKEGFQPYWHQRVPPNDGGISLGQVHVAQLLSKSKRAMSNTPKAEVTR
ncbi:MAG: carbamoyltransferase HypF [Ignavibacteriales bacterium]|nr:carbamoyltransferase HypF [Ignavibacteriales bacterium]